MNGPPANNGFVPELPAGKKYNSNWKLTLLKVSQEIVGNGAHLIAQ